MHPFSVGDIVVCIDDTQLPTLPRRPRTWPIRHGSIYRVSATTRAANGDFGVSLLGLPDLPSGSGWHVWRFRRLERADDEFIFRLRAIVSRYRGITTEPPTTLRLSKFCVGSIGICINDWSLEGQRHQLRRGRAYRITEVMKKADGYYLILQGPKGALGPYPENWFKKLDRSLDTFKDILMAATYRLRRREAVDIALGVDASAWTTEFRAFLLDVRQILDEPPWTGKFTTFTYYPNGEVSVGGCTWGSGIQSSLLPGDYRKRFNAPVPAWVKLIHPVHINRLCRLAMEKGYELPKDPYRFRVN